MPDEKIKKDVQPEAVDLSAQLDAANATIASLQGEIASMKAAQPAPTADDVVKADLPEPVRKRIEDLEKRAAVFEAMAKSERDARVEREWIAKAEGIQFVEAAKFGPILKRIAERETTDDDVSELLRVLHAAGEQVDKGDLFKKVSKDECPSSGGAMSKLHSLAKALREATPGLTEAQSVVKVLEQNPALYDQYLAEG